MRTTISELASTFTALKKSFPAEAKFEAELNVMRLFSKFVGNAEQFEKAMQKQNPFLAASVSDISYVADNSKNTSLATACKLILDLPLSVVASKDSIESLVFSSNRFKGLTFKTSGIYDFKNLHVTMRVEADPFLQQVVDTEKSIKNLTIELKSTDSFGSLQHVISQVKQESDEYSSKLCKSVRTAKANLEKRMLNLGLTASELEFYRSFW